MSRLAEIYKSEKSKGSGLGHALGKRFFEKYDPRQIVDQEGLMSAMFPSLKEYDATGKGKWKDEGRSGKKIGSSRRGSSSVSHIARKINSGYDNPLGASLDSGKSIDLLEGIESDTHSIDKTLKLMFKVMAGTPTDRAKAYFNKSGANSPSKTNQIDPRTGKIITRKDKLKDTGTNMLDDIGSGIGSIFKGIGSAAGIASIGVGIGGFLAGIGAGGAAVTAMGGTRGVKDILVALGEGLNAFNTQSLMGFGALLTGSGIFGAVAGPGPAFASGIAIGAIGFGLGAFLTGLSGGGKLSEKIGGSAGLKDILVALGTGLEPLSKLDGKNLMSIGEGMEGLGKGILALYASKAGDSIVNGVKTFMQKFGVGDGANKKTIFQHIAEDMKSFDDVNAAKLTDAAKGIEAITDALKALGSLTDDELAQAARAKGIALAAPGSTVGSDASLSRPALNTTSPNPSPNWEALGYKGANYLLEGAKTGISGSWSVGTTVLDKLGNPLLDKAAEAIKNSGSSGSSKQHGASGSWDSAPTGTPSTPTGVREQNSGLLQDNESDQNSRRMQSNASGNSVKSGSPTKANAALMDGGKAGKASPFIKSASGEGSDLLDMIASVEGTGDYNQLVYGRDGNNVPRDADLVNMTLDEVDQYQSQMTAQGHASSAVGRYQIKQSTLRNARRNAGLSGSDKFSPENQDKLALSLMVGRGYNQWKAGNIPTEQFADSLANEWAGLPNSFGISMYQGQNGNAASTRVKRPDVIATLNANKSGGSAPSLAQVPTTSGAGVNNASLGAGYAPNGAAVPPLVVTIPPPQVPAGSPMGGMFGADVMDTEIGRILMRRMYQ